MKTYYDQRRIYFHNIRFSGVEEERLQERRKKFRFESVSDFIRAAGLQAPPHHGHPRQPHERAHYLAW